MILAGGQFESARGGHFGSARGGQFESATGGHFESARGGQFKSAEGGQFECVLQLQELVFTGATLIKTRQIWICLFFQKGFITCTLKNQMICLTKN